MTSVDTIHHRKFNFLCLRESPLHTQVLHNKYSSTPLKESCKMYPKVQNKFYERKTQFPPRSCNQIGTEANNNNWKVPVSDLVNTLELESLPLSYSESSSEVSPSPSSSPSPRMFSMPAPVVYSEDNSVTSNKNPKLPFETHSDLRKRLLKIQNQGQVLMDENLDYWRRNQLDKEKKKYSRKINSLFFNNNEYSFESSSGLEKENSSDFENFYKHDNRSLSEKSHHAKGCRCTWLKMRHSHFKKALQESDKCICNQPSATISCRVCGYVEKTRLKKTCKFHPNRIFLSDIDQCKKCLTYTKLGFFEEGPDYPKI